MYYYIHMHQRERGALSLSMTRIDYPRLLSYSFSFPSSLFFLFLISAAWPGIRCIFEPNKYDRTTEIEFIDRTNKRVAGLFMRDDSWSSIDDRIESPVDPRLFGSSLIQFIALHPFDVCSGCLYTLESTLNLVSILFGCRSLLI